MSTQVDPPPTGPVRWDKPFALKLLGDMQRMLQADQVNVWMYVLPQISVARKPLKGIWTSSPVFANDLAALSW